MAIIFRINIPNVNEGHPRYSVGRTLSTNLVYTIWAVFGGFILHFLLSNYLTVLLRPNFEKPVDTAADLISRNITPEVQPHQKIYIQIFVNSPDLIYQELSQRLLVLKSVKSYTGLHSGHNFCPKFRRLLLLLKGFPMVSSEPTWHMSCVQKRVSKSPNRPILRQFYALPKHTSVHFEPPMTSVCWVN